VADDSERSRAMRFMILTAARVSNVVRNRDKPIAERTKNKKRDYDHRVPLSDAAIALLGEPRKSGPLFPGVTRQDLSSYIIKARKGYTDDHHSRLPRYVCDVGAGRLETAPRFRGA
jgi:integrase